MLTSSTRTAFSRLAGGIGAVTAAVLIVSVLPGTAEGAATASVLYLGADTSARGQLMTAAPQTPRANTTTTGKNTGWVELRAGGTPGTATLLRSAPEPSGYGYLWTDSVLDGATVATGSWAAAITLRASGTVKLVPTVRFYLRDVSGGGYRLIGYTSGSTVSLGSAAQKLTLPKVSISPITPAPGEHLYVDVVAKITYACCKNAAVISYDDGGSGQSVSIPPLQTTPASAPSSPTPGPTASSPTPTPTAFSPTPTPTAYSPTPAPTSPTLTSSSPAAAPASPWVPRPGTSWQWQITGIVDPNLPVEMYDIDLFDAQPAASAYTVPGLGTVNVPQGDNAGIIAKLHARGKKVICYLDTGAWENYRPDKSLFPAAVIGNTTGWSGERWLDIRRAAWPSFEPLIEARLDLAVRSGCDGVEPDQNNPLGNNPGFPITAADQKAWYLEVARIAHARGLSVGQKNGIETTDADTVAAFDWNLNEECNMYSECDVLNGFVAAGKAVFQVEYSDEGMTTGAFCSKDNAADFDGLLKTLALDVWVQSCR